MSIETQLAGSVVAIRLLFVTSLLPVQAQGTTSLYLPMLTRNDRFRGAYGSLVLTGGLASGEKVTLRMPATGGFVELATSDVEEDGTYWLPFEQPLRGSYYEVHYAAPPGMEASRIGSASMGFSWPLEGEAQIPSWALDPVFTVSPLNAQTITCTHMFQWTIPASQFDGYEMQLRVDPRGTETHPFLLQTVNDPGSAMVLMPCGVGIGDFHIGSEYEWELSGVQSDGDFQRSWRVNGGYFKLRAP